MFLDTVYHVALIVTPNAEGAPKMVRMAQLVEEEQKWRSSVGCPRSPCKKDLCGYLR